MYAADVLNLFFEPPPTPTAWPEEPPDAACGRCGKSCGPGEALASGCPNCRGQPLPWLRTVRLGAWSGELREALLDCKYQGVWRQADIFGQQLADKLARPVGGAPRVIPVPMARLRQAQRGFNQAELIARALAKARDWPMARPLKRQGLQTLHRVRATKRQKLARQYHLKRQASAQVTGCACVLVDDILTTGATAKACAHLLKQAGAASVTLAVVAVADRK